jgi:hypothetical protein
MGVGQDGTVVWRYYNSGDDITLASEDNKSAQPVGEGWHQNDGKSTHDH